MLLKRARVHVFCYVAFAHNRTGLSHQHTNQKTRAPARANQKTPAIPTTATTLSPNRARCVLKRVFEHVSLYASRLSVHAIKACKGTCLLLCCVCSQQNRSQSSTHQSENESSSSSESEDSSDSDDGDDVISEPGEVCT